jgi:uncharacterized protein
VIAALSSPATYPGRPQVRVQETHASLVFLAGEGAYKVKKQVRFDFLDYSTLARRRRSCLEEVRVNAALAPGVYLGVRAIVPRGRGYAFVDADDQEAVEYAVAMRRFAERDTLAGAIAARTLSKADLDRVGAALARFHATARQVRRGGGVEDVRALWLANLAELARIPGAEDLDPPALHAMERFGEAFLSAHRAELQRRLREGRIRDGHGDLRCDHVLLQPAVSVIDRIEFDPSLRRGDVALDLAFLTMDLELRRRLAAARELIAAYRHHGGSPGSEQLRCFYAAYRALVRAKVTLLALDETRTRRQTARSRPKSARAQAEGADLRQAQRLWELSQRLCWRARRPLAIVICGPPASGKSTLAAALRRRSGLPVIASDRVRKRILGIPATATAEPSHYGSEVMHATYDALSRQALERVRRDGGAIVDATCLTRARRAPIVNRLAQAEATVLFVCCEVQGALAIRRAAERMSDAGRISDATPEVAASLRRSFQPLSEIEPQHVLGLDASAPLADQVREVAAAIDRLLARISALPRRSGVFAR